MLFDNIQPLNNGILNVIVETPKHSQSKFAWDPELQVFRVKKTLPMGMVFPFDFGFLPGTKGGDGDPLDVLVIMEQACFPGCLTECRILGVLEAKQKEKGKKPERNDRIVALSVHSVLFENIQTVKELNRHLVSQIENFFINYNRQEGKKFTPLGWSDATKAKKLIQVSINGQ